MHFLGFSISYTEKRKGETADFVLPGFSGFPLYSRESAVSPLEKRFETFRKLEKLRTKITVAIL
jgi:hypothetical protein